MLGARRSSLAPAASEAESTCPEPGCPAGRAPTPPCPCPHGAGSGGQPQVSRQAATLGACGGFRRGGVYTHRGTLAVGTEQGDTAHVQCQTRREGKGTNLDPQSKRTPNETLPSLKQP